MKLHTRAVAVGVAALLSSAFLTGSAQAVTTVKPVRAGDFIAALSDTRATGHVDFLREGVHLWTESNTSTDKVAEYFAMGPALPTSGNLEWYGTTPQPGAQIVFDFDGTTGNGNDYNVLVGEAVYGTDAAGNYTDWWLSNGSSAAAKEVCPQTTGGSGSPCHGTLAEWATALTSETVYAGGFSLGSGVKGDGVLRAVNFGDTSYEFTDTAEVVPPTPPTPAPKVDVTGDVTVKSPGRRVKLIFTSDATPTGAVEGKQLVWKVKVDGDSVAKYTQGADEDDQWATRFTDRAKHKVEIYKNGDKVKTVKVG